MENLNRKKWEDLDLTRDEIKNIGEALKKEEFRNLLIDYVKEITDPHNRKQYEEEITQLENERGVDVKFIHPLSGYVIKTSVNGETKAFINICSNDNVGKPSSTPGVDEGHQGLQWSIPYCMAPPREDVDKKNKSCIVYDVVFHPDTLHLAKSNEAFKNLVNNTALDGVEGSFHVSLDKVNLKFPKITFKGAKHATVIRKKLENFQPGEYSEIPNYPYPPPKDTHDPDAKPSEAKTTSRANGEKSKPNFATPKFKIKHRNTVDIQNYTNDTLTKMSVTIPDELVIEIDLPLLKNCSDASIDVTDKTLNLQSESPAKYKLDLTLPYQVDSSKGNAKFDNVKRVLIVTLPVVKSKYKLNSLVDSTREDSGVESDLNNGRSNSVSSSDDDVLENDHRKVNEKKVVEHESKSDDCNKLRKRFLNPNIHYIIPNFNCQVIKDVLTFTLQVPNVNPDSVEYCFLSKFSGFHLTLVSIGSSFFPVHYSLFVRLPIQMENETFHVEVWDNNVIAQMKLTAFDVQTFEYYVGIDERNVKVHSLLSNDNFQNQGESTDLNHQNSDEEDLNEVSEESGIHNLSQSLKSFVDNGKGELSDILEHSKEEIGDHQNGNKEKKLIKVIRDLSISESGASSFDESSSSPTHQKPAKCRTFSESHNGERPQSRGILKVGRSLSESSADDYLLWNDENGEKPKKTVRFSDAIQTQTFRMNSSILGQRKKNQRKTRNKKRAMERRLSESGGESEGENEVPLMNKNIDVWSKDTESSDFSEVSEISDVSESAESDDGQKEDSKPFVPCSSKRNHKRRGKKSARKSAATAKFQYMEN